MGSETRNPQDGLVDTVEIVGDVMEAVSPRRWDASRGVRRRTVMITRSASRIGTAIVPEMVALTATGIRRTGSWWRRRACMASRC